MSDDLDSHFSEYAKQDYSYDVNSDDTVDATAVIDYAHPKYLGDASDMEKLKRKRQLVNQYIFASQLELEFKKINVLMEVQTSKATKFINSLNTEVIQQEILKQANENQVSLIQKSIKQSYKTLSKINDNEMLKQKECDLE